MVRLPVTLTEDEYRAVFNFAKRERRAARDQAALLIVDALRVRGLLPTNSNADGRNPSAFVASQAGAGDALAIVAHDAPEGGLHASR